jgi:hypothetical protein
MFYESQRKIKNCKGKFKIKDNMPPNKRIEKNNLKESQRLGRMW